jgi:hypothetical protein
MARTVSTASVRAESSIERTRSLSWVRGSLCAIVEDPF